MCRHRPLVAEERISQNAEQKPNFFSLSFFRSLALSLLVFFVFAP